MIRDIFIENFRCFRSLEIQGAKRINLIVGDNGVGKTSVLEAIFLALSRNVEVSLRLKTFRGLIGSFSGTPWAVGEAFWQDYFHDLDWSKNIHISLMGSASASNSLKISLTDGANLLPNLDPTSKILEARAVSQQLPLTFTWRGADGQEFTVSPVISGGQVSIPAGPMKSNANFFAAGVTPGLLETVERFSFLRRQNKGKIFTEMFTREFDFISDLSVEVNAGQPMIYATLKKLDFNYQSAPYLVA